MQTCVIMHTWTVRTTIEELTIFHIIIVNRNKLVSIWSALLVPATKCMEHLMYHNARVFTASSYGDPLASSHKSNIGVAPV